MSSFLFADKGTSYPSKQQVIIQVEKRILDNPAITTR